MSGGAVIESAEGQLNGQMTLDAGKWSIVGTFINENSDLTIRNGGSLTATDILPGELSSFTRIDGSGSRMRANGLLDHVGNIRVKSGGVLSAGRADLRVGAVTADANGSFDVDGDLSSDYGLSVFNGGSMTARRLTIGTTPGRSGLLSIQDSSSETFIAGEILAGNGGEATILAKNGATVTSQSLKAGIELTGQGHLSVDTKSQTRFPRILSSA